MLITFERAGHPLQAGERGAPAEAQRHEQVLLLGHSGKRGKETAEHDGAHAAAAAAKQKEKTGGEALTVLHLARGLGGRERIEERVFWEKSSHLESQFLGLIDYKLNSRLTSHQL